MGIVLALVIVGLAGAAGWTTGQREAQTFSEATRQAEIQDQLGRIADDVNSGNSIMLAARLHFLATQTPGVDAVPGLVLTATQVYFDHLPTDTPTATEEPIVEATPTPTEEAVFIAPTDEGSGYDLDAMLAEAQRDMNLRPV